MMTRTRPAVKPTRTAPRPGRPFGEGIVGPARRPRRRPYTAADLAWAAETFNRPGPDWDALAAEAEATGRHERGYCL